jgi:Putative auto-transporter adhesin, head GIN domain
MKKLLVALSLILGLSVAAQEKVAEQRVVKESFNGVKVSDGIELILTQADDLSVNASASQQKYLDEVKTEVVSGILVISVKQKKWINNNYKNRWVKVKVSLPKLVSLDINDGCTVKNASKFDVANLNIACNDGSSVKLEDFNAVSLNVTVKDGSSMSLTGKSTNLNVEVNDGSSFDGDEFVSDVCNADANDGSSVKINVTKELTAAANDGSSIRYEGSPTIKKSTAKDGSSIKKS